MIPSLVPPDIIELHRALLAALRVDYFPPGMREMNNWRDFLDVMKPLQESEGGAFTAADITRAIALMRHQNKSKEANWSLRFFKIMSEPESFRDIVLIARKAARPRPPVETRTAKTGDGANVQVEHDPAAERNPVAIAEHVNELRRTLRMPPKEKP